MGGPQLKESISKKYSHSKCEKLITITQACICFVPCSLEKNAHQLFTEHCCRVMIVFRHHQGRRTTYSPRRRRGRGAEQHGSRNATLALQQKQRRGNSWSTVPRAEPRPSPSASHGRKTLSYHTVVSFLRSICRFVTAAQPFHVRNCGHQHLTAGRLHPIIQKFRSYVPSVGL